MVLIVPFLLYSMTACVRVQSGPPSSNVTINTTPISSANATIQPTMPAVQPPLPPATPISADEAMMAASYAQTHNVSIAEAVRRLRLQPLIGALDGRLTDNEKETFAGLWIEHTPNFRVVALFTSRGNETIARYLPAELQGMVEVRSAETSLAELVAIQENTIKIIEGLGIPAASDINVYENRVKFYVIDRSRLDSAIKDNRLVLSPKVDLVTVATLDALDVEAPNKQ